MVSDPCCLWSVARCVLRDVLLHWCEYIYIYIYLPELVALLVGQRFDLHLFGKQRQPLFVRVDHCRSATLHRDDYIARSQHYTASDVASLPCDVATLHYRIYSCNRDIPHAISGPAELAVNRCILAADPQRPIHRRHCAAHAVLVSAGGTSTARTLVPPSLPPYRHPLAAALRQGGHGTAALRRKGSLNALRRL